MKHHIGFKFLAIMLCACCLFVSIGAGLGIICLLEAGLYDTTVQALRLESEEYELSTAARQIAQRCAAKTYSNGSQELLDRYYHEYFGYGDLYWDLGQLHYTLADSQGNLLDSQVDQAAIQGAQIYEKVISTTYPMVLNHTLVDPWTGESPDTTNATMPQTSIAGQETVPETQTQDAASATTGDIDYLHIDHWAYEDMDGIHQYDLAICQGPEYRVTVYLTGDVYTRQEDHWSWKLAEFGYEHRYHAIWVLGAALLLFAVFYVYLCCAAGKKPKSDEVAPGGLNRLPLDLYALGVGGAVVLLAVSGYELIRWNMDYFWEMGFHGTQGLLVLGVCAMAFLGCLLVVGFLFACAAQFKMRKFYWLKHSLTGMLAIGCFRLLKAMVDWTGQLARWLENKLPAAAKNLWAAVKWLWGLLVKVIIGVYRTLQTLLKGLFVWLGKVLAALWRGLGEFAQLLPHTWQWLLVGIVMVFVLLACLSTHNTAMQFFGLVACICIVMYGAHCFGILLDSTKRMSGGDLETKVEDKLLLGSFREYADHLNALADVAVESARKQMKSERMKAELVTNVSHDIKTPLTSIINYVDLLQKAESQDQAEEYLEVLDRQAQRLKKLIEDLMEMSKASTGNMSVELTAVDPVEAVNQALGEFSEKLELASLTPVFVPPAESLRMVADGRLTWRVLSNLLSNAVKYALPGTRLYIDLQELNGQVLISLKNISREQLNVSSEELMERFVRGDASRNTEGSGLGLNIAKSLMELQRGQLQLLVDGDLFKATLIFPKQD